jgi:hypothetical protein
MKKLFGACLLFAAFVWLPAGAYGAAKCPTTFNPKSFTKGDFFSNFNNSCYLIAFSTGNGSGSEQGDLDSVYNKLFFRISQNLPPYQLIIIGDFPNARYFSVGLYDNHSAITQNLSDVDVVPLTSGDINPFQPGVAFVSGQQYAVPINLGGTPGTPQTGCVMTGYNVDVNAMDGTQRHAFMNWNLNPGYFKSGSNIPTHVVDTPTHSNPNTAGVIIIRNYLTLTPSTAATLPHVIVRDIASGCAYPASMVNYADTTTGVVTTGSNVGNTWQEQSQVQNHNSYANWQPTDCWGIIPSSSIQWIRGDEYTPGANPDASYLYAYTPSGLPQTLSNANEVIRLRFQVPTTPPTPCTNGCARSGNEQMRYLSLSFQNTGGGTLASLPDSCPANPITACTPLIQDPNGFVTVIVGTGVAQPSWVTPANGYTWLDLSKVANYQTLNEIAIRNILPASSFSCGGEMVPYKTGQATTRVPNQNQVYGLMGLYAPVIDYPVASTLPPAASEITGPSTCAMYPSGPPAVSPNCAVLTENNSPTIGAVTTQCAAPGCTQVVLQPQPPLSILSLSGTGGFGIFPLGLPYMGTTNFLRIQDLTQGWSAGYTGDKCTLTIGEWSDTAISVVANVNMNGVCPMAANDALNVTVWNPQNTATSASFGVIVQP